MVKILPAMQEMWVRSLGQEDPLEREWLPTPVFLPGEFHGQRSLVGYSPWGHKELDITERLTYTHPSGCCENSISIKTLSTYYVVVFSCQVVSNSATSWTIVHSPPFCCLTGCQLWAVCTQSCIQQIIVCAQSCVTLCNPMDCSPPGASVWNSSRQESWSGLPFPTPGDLPGPGVEPVSLASSTLARWILYHAAAAKWLQLCPTLCDPIDPPGSSVPGILQARTPEWGC